MDAETKVLLETELRGIEDSWEIYALGGFRLARIVVDRDTARGWNDGRADFAAQRVLAHYERSGEPKAGADLEELVSDIDGLTGVVRVMVGGTRDAKTSPVRALLEKVRGLESQLGILRLSDGREARLGVTSTRVEELRELARTAAADASGEALRDAVRFYDLVRKAWEGTRDEYNELDTTADRLGGELAEARQQVLRGELQVIAVEERVKTAITWLVTVNANQPASIIADRAKLALRALRDGSTE